MDENVESSRAGVQPPRVVAYGIAAMIAFALLSALRDVAAKELFIKHDASPVLLTWVSCVVTMAVFFPIGFLQARRSSIDVVTKGSLTTLIWLNVTTTIAFVTAFLAIDQVDEFVASVVDYGGSPIAVTALAAAVLREPIRRRRLVGLGLAIVGIVVMAASASSGEHTGSALGVVYALVSATAMAVNNLLSKTLMVRKLPRATVLFARLPVPIVVLGAWLVARPDELARDVHLLPLIALWGLLGVSLPLYLLLFALDRLFLRSVAVYFFFIPLFTWVGAVLAPNHHSPTVVSFIAGVLIILGVYTAERMGGDPRSQSDASPGRPGVRLTK